MLWADERLDSRTPDDEDLLVDEEGSARLLYRDSDARFGLCHRPLRRTVMKTLVGAVILSLCGLCLWTTVKPSHEEPDSVDGFLKEQQLIGKTEDAACDAVEEDMDYVFEDAYLVLMENVAAPHRCCALCRVNDKCHGWTWVRNSSRDDGSTIHQCWLKGGILSMKVPKQGVMSGTSGRHRHSMYLTKETPYWEPLERTYQGCVNAEVDVDYVFQGDWLGLIDEVFDAASCCTLCQNRGQCTGWTWVGKNPVDGAKPNQCWLKGGVLVQKVPKFGTTSGFGKPIYPMAPTEPPSVAVVPLPPATTVPAITVPAATVPATTVPAIPPALATMVPATTPPAIPPVLAASVPASTMEAAPMTTTTKATTTAASSTTSPTTTTVAATTTAASTTTVLPACAGPDEHGSCLESACCKAAGHQCFKKNDFWAECMVDCVPGPRLLDNASSELWSCRKVGDRAPGEPKKERCAAGGDNCVEAACCTGLGMQCFAKNRTFGVCKQACEPGVDLTDEDWHPWSCEKVGRRTPSVASWVTSKCAHTADNCLEAQCCAEGGKQCFRKNPYYGECKATCTPTAGDECGVVGPRTPEAVHKEEDSNTTKIVGTWVESRCSALWENCIESACCQEVGAQCYARDSKYATCRRTCSSSEVQEDNFTWSCDAIGPRSWGLATKGYPSLYCFTLYMPERYEKPLLQSVLKMNAGIFRCDGYDVFASSEDALGVSTDGLKVKAILIPNITVGVSQDGTAANAKLFMAVWDKVIATGRFRYFDWTLKVDPDAVLLPWRLRKHVLPHVGKTLYFVNCNKYPTSPNFPMMYGAVEVFSQSAMVAYADGSAKCGKELPWHKWGEDYYMTHCMDYLGVGRVGDYAMLGDNMCTGADCSNGEVSSFHPFKSLESWRACWNRAIGH